MPALLRLVGVFRRYFGPLWFCCLFALNGAAQQYRFDHWTTDDGLPQNSVSSVVQTRDGYLWFTTFDGLVRYDGVTFKVFNKSNSPGLKATRLGYLYEAADGALWVSGDEGGLTRYQNGVFTAYGVAEGLPPARILALSGDTGGRLLVMTTAGSVQWRDGRFVPLDEPLARTTFAYLGPTGTLWALDEKGLHRFRDGRQETFSHPVLPNNYLMYEDHNGGLWIGAQGVLYFKDGVFTHYRRGHELPADARDRSESPFCIREDRQGRLWFGYATGLFYFENGRFERLTTADGLPDNYIRAIFQDREGTLWLGTDVSGLVRVTRRFLRTYSTDQGLTNKNVYPLLETRNGDIWLGMLPGLNRFAGGKFEDFSIGRGLIGDTIYFPAGQRQRAIVSALAEENERLWVGGNNMLASLAGGKMTDEIGLLGEKAIRVWAILQDRRGAVWFGTDKGLYRRENGSVTRYTTREGLPGNDVKAIHEARDGTLWFATYSGLARWQNGGFVSFTEKDGLGSNHLRAIYEDAGGTLWLGTYDGGLSRFRDGRFTNYTTADGLFSNGVFYILEDGRGNFWMSSNQGLGRVAKQNLEDFAAGRTASISCTTYGKQDGMLNTECNGGRQPAGLKTRDGKLWFPTLDGVVVIDPEAVSFNAQPPPVLLENVSIDRAAAPFANGAELNPGQGNLEISYAGLSFIKPEQVRFKYKLEGLDDAWIDAGTRRTVYYPYLPPGGYTFRVIAANADGVWNETGAALAIVVRPAFYRTWWFVTLAALALAGAAFLVFRWRVRQLRRAEALQTAFAQQMMASQEQERQRIAAELHDSLSQRLVVVKNMALLALLGEPAQDLRNKLEGISDETSRALGEVKEISYNLRPYQLDRLGLTKALESLLEQAANSSQMDFTVALDNLDGVLKPELEIHLYRIAQESLNNILKHSDASAVTARASHADGQLRLTIADDGVGFTPDATTPNRRSGFGLIGLNERARALGGTASVTSQPGQGTVVEVSISV